MHVGEVVASFSYHPEKRFNVQFIVFVLNTYISIGENGANNSFHSDPFWLLILTAMSQFIRQVNFTLRFYGCRWNEALDRR